MGTYKPAKNRHKRNLSQALHEAEQDHYLDCPDADLLIRGAAFVLDGIFLFLLISSFNRFLNVVWIAPEAEEVSNLYFSFVVSLKWFSSCSLFYFFYLWTIVRFGGSPGKIALGLRILDSQTGAKIPLHRVLLRELVGKILLNVVTGGAGLLLPLYRPDMRTLHDLISKSTVKRVHQEL